jgi:hypothetical protein
VTTQTWIRKLFARSPRSGGKAPLRQRPALEVLEDRVVMSLTLPGYYSQDGQEPGIPAPPGYYVDTVGATAPTIDPLGYYTDQPASVAPIPAPPGTYVPTVGATAATLDPLGYYTDQPASVAPIPAPPGTFVGVVGATAATLDPVGYYTDQYASVAPVPAPPGTFVGTLGATAATLDPLGYYTDQPASVAPIPAPLGYYVDTVGATFATPAPLGTYVPTVGASAPTLAPPGSYVDTVGATSATLAPPGYYVPIAGATQPTPASPGYYVPFAGATQQIPDPPGTYSGFAATTYSLTNPASPAGGLSQGFWGNKNGQAIETLSDFSVLTSLNLRTASGGNADFTSSLAQDRTAFANWLAGAKVGNMAYMLSAQLAATELNVLHGFVNPNASVNVAFVSSAFNTFGSASALSAALNSGPNPILVDQYGQIRISALIDAANASLGANGNTTGPGAARAYQEALKDVLDAINNNQALILS